MKSRKFLYVLPFLLLCSCASRTYFINQKSYTEDAHTDIIKVTFSYENGEEDSYENLNRGDKISEIKNPVRSGYEFLGWYFDDSPWDFKTGVVSTNMTLTANWIGKRDNSGKQYNKTNKLFASKKGSLFSFYGFCFFEIIKHRCFPHRR